MVHQNNFLKSRKPPPGGFRLAASPGRDQSRGYPPAAQTTLTHRRKAAVTGLNQQIITALYYAIILKVLFEESHREPLTAR